MPLLLDKDYAFLAETGVSFVEDEQSRFLILKNFNLPAGVYASGGRPRNVVDVLYVVPPTYNTEGGDMFWVNPQLERIDGIAIPNIGASGQDSRTHNGIEYVRWSRHWNKTPWRPKVDSIVTIIDRLTWALKCPDAKR